MERPNECLHVEVSSVQIQKRKEKKRKLSHGKFASEVDNGAFTEIDSSNWLDSSSTTKIDTRCELCRRQDSGLATLLLSKPAGYPAFFAGLCHGPSVYFARAGAAGVLMHLGNRFSLL